MILGEVPAFQGMREAELGVDAHRLGALHDVDADRSQRVGHEEGGRLARHFGEALQFRLGDGAQIHLVANDHPQVEEPHAEAIALRLRIPGQVGTGFEGGDDPQQRRLRDAEALTEIGQPQLGCLGREAVEHLHHAVGALNEIRHRRLLP